MEKEAEEEQVMSPYTTIHACVTYCTDLEGVKIEPSAQPFIEEWLKQEGYEKATNQQEKL